jgi:hypothetical protein
LDGLWSSAAWILYRTGDDAIGEVHLRQDPSATGPGQPAIQGDLAGLALGDKEVA